MGVCGNFTQISCHLTIRRALSATICSKLPHSQKLTSKLNPAKLCNDPKADIDQSVFIIHRRYKIEEIWRFKLTKAINFATVHRAILPSTSENTIKQATPNKMEILEVFDQDWSPPMNDCVNYLLKRFHFR